MATTSSGGEPAHATADREIVISQVIGAPRELVFEAFTRVRHVSRWWGPEGFTTTTRSFEFRVGGEWDFVIHGPDGTAYQEWITWREIVPPERIALLHGESRDDPNAFESVLTFEPVRPPRAGPGPHGGIGPGDPPDLHRRETLAGVPAACGAGVSPQGEVPVGQVSSSVRSGNRTRRP
jgi:uncharacterized protein YndB with AHSA1/START domain